MDPPLLEGPCYICEITARYRKGGTEYFLPTGEINPIRKKTQQISVFSLHI
jgi:hypothetical protein